MVYAKALKLSEYKDVFQVSSPDGTKHIVKTFKGWAKVHCHNNAKYTLNAIQLLSSHLTCARLPAWAELSEDDVSVRMELLSELFAGKLIFANNYVYFRQFFSEIYRIPNTHSWIKDIRESQVISEAIRNAIPAEQPMAIGFKGDAWGNVLLSKNALVLADVEDICLEPLGFSEVIALLEMTTAATSGKPEAIYALFWYPRIQPAFIDFLSQQQAIDVVMLARTAWEARIVSCGAWRKFCKIKIADWAVKHLLTMIDISHKRKPD